MSPPDSSTPDSFVRDWQALRADEAIQFGELQAQPPPESPAWLQSVLRAIGRMFAALFDAVGALGRLIGLTGPALLWVLGAFAVVALLLIAWRLLRQRSGGGAAAAAAEPAWHPGTATALALLEDADRLAAEGRFGEAAHLLLTRSVGQIAQAQPGTLSPASTAREIAALPSLPAPAARAFTTIASCVERSLFALRRLTTEDWQTARAAYADFALSGMERAPQ